MIVDFTPQELGQAVKLAKSLNKKIDVQRYTYCTVITIEDLPIGCGYGNVNIRLAKSHRKARQIMALGAHWLYSALNYKTFYYTIPNKPEVIAAAEKIGAVVMKSKPVVTDFKVMNKEQNARYDKDVMNRG